MKRFWALFEARNKEFYRDTGALSWNFIFPFLVVLGFAFAFSGGSQDIFKVALLKPAGAEASSAETAFKETKYIQFVPLEDQEAALAKLRRHQYDMVYAPPARYWINSSAPKGYLLERVLQGSAPSFHFEKQTVEGKEIRYVDWLVSGLLAMNMCFSALFGVGYTIVRYRKNGVLRRLKATPLAAFEFLTAQVASRMILLIGVIGIVYTGCNLLVHFQMLGSYWDLFLVLVAGAICLICLGLLVSARIASEELAGGILNVITWPMMFLSGVWFSMEGAHPLLKKAAQVFPLTHVIDGARAIMTEGAGLHEIAYHLWALAAMSVVFLIVGSISFKWE